MNTLIREFNNFYRVCILTNGIPPGHDYFVFQNYRTDDSDIKLERDVLMSALPLKPIYLDTWQIRSPYFSPLLLTVRLSKLSDSIRDFTGI
jgi:hypothetical protein